LSGGCRSLQACPFPRSHPVPHLAVEVLKLLGRVTHPKIVAPPPNDRVACCHYGRQCAPQTSSCRVGPNVAADGCHGFLARPHQGEQLPRRACSARVTVEPEQLTPGALHVDHARLGGRPRQLAFLQDLRDGLSGVRGRASRATDEQPIVGLPREVAQRPVLLGPVPIEPRPVAIGPHRADDAPVG
jgi:hypothetical protein